MPTTKTESMLFASHQFGGSTLANRVVMAPMTRSRADQPGDVPNELMATYYAQRAGAGLIITEGAPISPVGRGYSLTPGIHSAEQVAGWRKVTDAVHAAHGRIFVQLWHVGRRSHSSIAGEQPVSSSAVKEPDTVFGPLPAGGFGMIETGVPRAMTQADIRSTVADYVTAARNAMTAGFDGVELHGAHGYLLDQFMRLGSNLRDDEYGGGQENRIRFLLDATRAVAAEIGPERVGIRLSPFVTEGSAAQDPEIVELTLKVVEALAPLNLAHIHFSENISRFTQVPDSFREQVRLRYQNPILVTGGQTRASAEALLRNGYADLVGFGQPFITNPDLVRRMAHGVALAEVSSDAHSTFYGGGAKGYTDYPAAPRVSAQMTNGAANDAA